MSPSVHERLLIRGARVAGAELAPGAGTGDGSSRSSDVLLDGGRIARVAASIDPADARADVIDGSGLWLLPGLIDLQVNDIDWISRGMADPESHAARVREVASRLVARGVTGFVLATIAAPIPELLAYLAGMSRVLDERLAAADASFLGGLVEGTFMNPALHGAHDPRWILPPDRALVDRLIATRAMRLVNVAPEVPGEPLEVIARAARAGVIVGCGHAKPHAERVREAIAAGLRYIIHLGNGPTGSSLKSFHDGGLLEESLRNDDLFVTVIADGVHVHPVLIRDWIVRKELSRVAAVSDIGFALGAPSGPFQAFGVRGNVAPGGKFLYVESDSAAPAANPHSSDAVRLFGSALDQLGVFERLLDLLTTEMPGVGVRRHPALPLAEAIGAAAALCSTNPARLLGLADRGRIEPGARADCALAGVSGSPGAWKVTLHSTCISGLPEAPTVHAFPGLDGRSRAS